MQWLTVAEAADIPDATGLAVEAAGKQIGLFRISGQVHAIDNVCPHAYALLSLGTLTGGHIECCLHGAVFNVSTGQCRKGPAERDVQTYPVRQQGQLIQVGIDDT